MGMINMKVVSLIMVVMVFAFMEANASQLNLYKGKGCTGQFTVGWDRKCTDIPGDAVSYRFYYNPGWLALLFNSSGCDGLDVMKVLDSNVLCANISPKEYGSVLVTDEYSLQVE